MRKRNKLEKELTIQDIYDFFNNIFEQLKQLVPTYIQKHLYYKFIRQDTLIICQFIYQFQTYEAGIVSYSVHIGSLYLPNITAQAILKRLVFRIYSNVSVCLMEEEQDFLLDNLNQITIDDELEFYNQLIKYMTGEVKLKLEGWILLTKMANTYND